MGESNETGSLTYELPKACPFCNGRAVTASCSSWAPRGETTYWFGVRCENVRCVASQMPCTCKTAGEAVKIWNERAPIPTTNIKQLLPGIDGVNFARTALKTIDKLGGKLGHISLYPDTVRSILEYVETLEARVAEIRLIETTLGKGWLRRLAANLMPSDVVITNSTNQDQST